MAIERGGFLLFLALVTAALVFIAWPFAAPLLCASLAAIMFQPLYHFMLNWRAGKASQAAILTLLVITVAVIIPAIIIGGMVADEAIAVFEAFGEGQIDVASWFRHIFAALPGSIQTSLTASGLGDLAGLQDKAQEFAEQSLGLIASQAVAIGSGVFGWVLAFGIGLYVTFFLLRDGASLGAKLLAALPMDDQIAKMMGERFLSIVRATIKGSVVVGLVQGALGTVTFWIAGVPSAILFGVLMAFFSLLPAVGPALVWLPVAVYLLATGDIWQGVLVVISGVAIIGMADNVLRPILVGRDTGIPDWIILISTLGGIAAMGLAGIVIGPVIAGLFLTAWGVMAQQREAAIPVA